MAKELNIDNHKLIYHPKKVAEWMEKGDCYPVYLEISPTNRCNHRCIFCAYDFIKRDNSDIGKEIMLKALKDMADNGVKSVMFSGEGESLLHDNICEFIEKAKKYGLDVSLATNGSLFNKEKAERCLPYLSWVRFSVDAGTPETYSFIHNTQKESFNKLIENIKNAVEIRNKNNFKTTIGVQFLLMPQNSKEVVKFAEIIKETGADNIQIKPYSQHPDSINKFVINYEDYAYLEPEIEKFNSENFTVFFRKQTMKRAGQEIAYPKCYGLSFFSIIDSKGNVIPCHLFLENPEFIYGNLYEKSFSEIWQGEKRKQVLEKIMQRGIKNCKKTCRADAFNQYLYRIKNPEPHDNFI